MDFDCTSPHPINERAGSQAKRRLVFAGGIALCLSALPAPARAFDFSLKIEPGFAVPVTNPQSHLFGTLGGAVSVKALFELGPYVDIGPTAMFVGLPASERAPSTDAGIGWGLGGGMRLKRPHDNAGIGMGAVSPWLDGDLLYMRTGPLNRFAFTVGAGFSFPLDEARRFWLGPFMRYLQIVQPERTGYDNADAKILIAGINFEFGSAHRRPVAAEPQPVVQCPPAVQCAPVVERAPAVADRDHDGVPDDSDLCPDVAGTIEHRGCPSYEKIVVKKDKIELKEHILFAFDQAVIESDSYPLLDEVVKALRDNHSFHVGIEGHTDSKGGDAHNQPLSERRAQAVLDYLVKHGVPTERLHSKGFGSSVPLETNKTAAGREANRRVEFMVDLVILNKDGSVK